MAVEKKSISLSGETLAQLEWIKKNVFRCYISIPFSKLIAMSIDYMYWQCMKDRNKL